MKIHFDHADLESLITKVLTELDDRFRDDDRLAFDEATAAKLISLKKHQLRDERLKGRICPGKSGRSWLYSRRMLLQYIEQNMEPEE